MPKYKIMYYFDGKGETTVEAKNEEEAEKMFYEGECDYDNEWGDTYIAYKIEKE